MSQPQAPPDHVTPYDRFAWSDTVVEHLLATGQQQRELTAYFGADEYEALASLAREAHAAPLRADAPRVFIVPGIMGSQLGRLRKAPLPNDILWLDPVDISLGNLSLLRLPLPKPAKVPTRGRAQTAAVSVEAAAKRASVKTSARASPPLAQAVESTQIVSLGVVLFTYLRLKLHLRIAGFAPVFHDYDWRLGIEPLGRALAERLRAQDSPVMVVAHSMGGLVSRAALASDGMKKVERIILLGTPNSGSYAPVQALRGVYAVVRKIARLAAREQSAESLAADVFRTFPSLYDLLPVTTNDSGLDLFDVSAWPDSGPRPDVPLLTNARSLASRLADADERFINVIGVGQETVTRAIRRRDEFIYTITRHGDGTVPRSCAELPGARTYYTSVAHSELGRDAAVAHAVADLLDTGKTLRLQTHRSSRGKAEARISDHALRRTHTGKVDWVHMTPDARQAFLRELNEPPHLKLRLPAKAKPRKRKRQGAAAARRR